MHVPVLMAIDWHAPEYEVTLATDAPQLMSTAGGSQSQSSAPPWVIRGSGHSLTSALQRLGINYPNANPLPLAHLRIVVLGHGALTPAILNTVWDRFNRSRYLHRTFWVFGTRGSAAIIAEATNPTGPDPAHALEEALESARASGWVKPLRFYHIAETLYNTSDSGIVLPMVSVESEQGPNPGALSRFPGAWVLTHQGGCRGPMVPVTSRNMDAVMKRPSSSAVDRPGRTVSVRGRRCDQDTASSLLETRHYPRPNLNICIITGDRWRTTQPCTRGHEGARTGVGCSISRSDRPTSAMDATASGRRSRHRHGSRCPTPRLVSRPR